MQVQAAAVSKQKRDKRVSPWFKLAIEMGPLILFFFANARPKLFEPAVALIVPPVDLDGPQRRAFHRDCRLMAAVAAALAVSFVLTRRLPAVPSDDRGFGARLRGLTLYLHDATFIKMKPTMLYAGFGTALIGGLAMNKPILPIIFDHAMALTEEAGGSSPCAGEASFLRLRF